MDTRSENFYEITTPCKTAMAPDTSRMIWLHAGQEFSLELTRTVRQLYKELNDRALGVALHAESPSTLSLSDVTYQENLSGNPAIETLLPQHIDPVTGLRTRNYLLHYIQRHLHPEEAFFTIVCDIDQFRAISHFYGNEAEAFTLISIAERLQKSLPSSQVFKLSGDQFLILIPALMMQEERLEVILEQLSRYELNWRDYQINISTSFGVARQHCGQLDAAELSELLSNTNMALNQAKRLKRSTFFFSGEPHLKLEYGQYLRGVGLLSDALKQDTLEAFYQPIICNHSGKLLSFECLARIRHKYGWIGANQFIPQASQFRLQGALTLKILEKACQAMQKTGDYFSINLAPEDLLNETILNTAIRLLQQYQIGQRVTIELVETSALLDLPEGQRAINKLKDAGCKLAIDDFGSGFANFSYLYKLKPDYLKLDGSLIKDLDHKPELRTIVRGIVNIAHELNIRTVAEYVHNEEIYHWVRKLDVDASQGFYFSPPRQTPVYLSS